MARTADHASSAGPSPKDVGKHLRDVRRKQGLSRAEVARSAGLTRRELAAYERGRSEVPESDLWCLAGSCGVDVAELLPQRPPVKVSTDLSMLAVGDSIRYLRSPVDDDDELLREYLAMIYELRNLPPGSKIPLRERDLMSLADALGGSPEKIEARLVDLIGISRPEASRLRQMIIPPQALPAADPLPIGEPYDADPPPPIGEPYANLAAPGQISRFANPYSELAASVEQADLTEPGVDFFSAPRAEDVFEAPPPPPLASPAVAWDEDLDPTMPAPMSPMAGGPDPIDVELANPLLQPEVEPELAPLPADPFAAPAPLMSDITDALNDDPMAEPFSAYAGDAFSSDAAETGFVVDAPTADIATSDSDLTIDESMTSFGRGPVDSDFEMDPPISDLLVDAPDVDAEPLADTASVDMPVVEDEVDMWPTAEPVAEQPAESMFDDLELDVLRESPIEVDEPVMVDEPAMVDALEWAPVTDDVPASPRVSWAHDITPIAWVAREDGAPEGAATPPGPRFERAGANWRVGGIFPATATADDGALALRRADARWALADIEAPADFTIEASVDFTAGAGFGVLFRASVDSTERVSGYSFDIDPIAGGGGYLIRQWEDNRQHWRPLAQATVTDAAMLFGRHTISVTLRADHLTVSVDNDPVLSVPGLSRLSVELGRPPCRGGSIGIQAWATTEVTIDSFQVARH